ncbi:hypothetical protein HYU14_06490 [Candidatus Woesearchaeota archaeon]|nr:hypothetical protein [Candidatus Woesearchaeota archaeon]
MAAELKDNVIETNAKVLIISPFDALLEEVGKEEQPYLMNFLMDEIKAVTRRFGVITVIGSTRRKIAGDNDSADNLPIALPPSLEGKVDQRFGV